MAAISAASGAQNTKRFSNVHSLNDLTADDFLQFLVTQLQQQDPLNPTSNQELLDQINSIRSLTATTQLTSTMGSVQVGQNLATASGLIGKSVKALDDKGNEVNGKVTSAQVTVDAKDETKREIRVQVGTNNIKLTNIREIVP